MDLRAEVWPLMAKEIAWGWYHELLHGHPDRVRLDADAFTARYTAAAWGSPEMAALLDEAVPDPLDHLDFRALDRPLDGVGAGSLDDLQPQVRAHITEDLRQHVDPAHTPHLGAFVAMLSVYAQVTPPGHRGRVDRPVEGPRHPVVAELLQRGRQRPARLPGPPAPGAVPGRVRAVPRAGDVDRGRRHRQRFSRFRAGGSAVPGEAVTATVMVDARLQEPSASRTADPLLAGLLRRGEIAEEVLVDDDGTVLRNTGEIRVRPADGALIDAQGRVHARRFAIGPHTNVRVAGAFTRPGTNAQSLRYNDAVARAVLRSLPATARASSAA